MRRGNSPVLGNRSHLVLLRSTRDAALPALLSRRAGFSCFGGCLRSLRGDGLGSCLPVLSLLACLVAFLPSPLQLLATDFLSGSLRCVACLRRRDLPASALVDSWPWLCGGLRGGGLGDASWAGLATGLACSGLACSGPAWFTLVGALDWTLGHLLTAPVFVPQRDFGELLAATSWRLLARSALLRCGSRLSLCCLRGRRRSLRGGSWCRLWPLRELVGPWRRRPSGPLFWSQPPVRHSPRRSGSARKAS